MPELDPKLLDLYFAGALTGDVRADVIASLRTSPESRAISRDWANGLLKGESRRQRNSSGDAAERVSGTTGLASYTANDFVCVEHAGLVFRAWDSRLERDVFVLLVPKPLVDSVLMRAAALARFQHPNLATIYEVTTAEGIGVIVMECPSGDSLAAWLRANPQDNHRVVELTCGLSQGLSAVHAEGLVHAHISPATVVVDASGAGLVMPFSVLSCDFVAQDFVAPELRRTGDSSASADQFALAMTLQQAFAQSEVTPPSRLMETLERATKPEPHQRFRDMKSFASPLSRRHAGRRNFLWLIASLTVAVGLASYYLATRGQSGDRVACQPSKTFDDSAAKTEKVLLAAADTQGVAKSTVAARFAFFRRSWQEQYQDSCRSMFQLRTQKRATFERRRSCLERMETKLRQLGRLVTKHGLKNGRIAGSLGQPSDCSADLVSNEIVALKDNDTERELLNQLLEAVFLFSNGASKQGLALIEAILARAHDTGSSVILGAAYLQRARRRDRSGQRADAQEDIKTAIRWAKQAGRGGTELRAWLLLAEMAQSKAVAEKYLLAADLIVDQLPQSDYLSRARVVMGYAKAEGRLGGGSATKSLDYMQQAFELIRGRDANTSKFGLAVQVGLARALKRVKKYSEAVERLKEAEKIVMEVSGEDSRDMLVVRAVLGDLARETRRPREAERHYRFVLSKLDPKVSRLHYGLLLTKLGETVQGQGRFQESVSYNERAASLQSGLLSNDLTNLGNLAVAQIYAGKPKQGLATLVRLEGLARQHDIESNTRDVLVQLLFQFRFLAYVVLRDYSAARKQLAWLADNHRAPVPNSFIVGAKLRLAAAAGQWGQACTLLPEDSIPTVRNAEDAESYLWRAYVCARAGEGFDDNKRVQALELLRDGDGSDIWARELVAMGEFARAEILWRQGNHADALRRARAALARVHAELPDFARLRDWVRIRKKSQ